MSNLVSIPGIQTTDTDPAAPPISAMRRQAWQPDGSRRAQALTRQIQSLAERTVRVPKRAAQWHKQLSVRLAAQEVATIRRATTARVDSLPEPDAALSPLLPEAGLSPPFPPPSAVQETWLAAAVSIPSPAEEPESSPPINVVKAIRSTGSDAQTTRSDIVHGGKSGAGNAQTAVGDARSAGLIVKAVVPTSNVEAPAFARLSRPPLQLAMLGASAPDSRPTRSDTNVGRQIGDELSPESPLPPSRLHLSAAPRAFQHRSEASSAPVVFPLRSMAGGDSPDTAPTAAEEQAQAERRVSSAGEQTSNARRPYFHTDLASVFPHVSVGDAANAFVSDFKNVSASDPTPTPLAADVVAPIVGSGTTSFAPKPFLPSVSADAVTPVTSIAPDADWAQRVAWPAPMLSEEPGAANPQQFPATWPGSDTAFETVHVSTPSHGAAPTDAEAMRGLVERLMREQGFPYAPTATPPPSAPTPAPAANTVNAQGASGRNAPASLDIHDLTARVAPRVADRLDAARRQSDRLERERKGFY